MIFCRTISNFLRAVKQTSSHSSNCCGRRTFKSRPVLLGSQVHTADDAGGDVAAYQRTALNIINADESEAVLIDAYSRLGFLLNNGIRVLGPLAIFPRSVLHWNVQSVEDINEESLSLFYLLEPKIDILVIGVGDRGHKIDPKVLLFMKSKKINVEMLPTDQACSTFNFLNAEKRYVAGALIPPQYVPLYEDDQMVLEGSNQDPFLVDWEHNPDEVREDDRLLEFMRPEPKPLQGVADRRQGSLGSFGLGDGDGRPQDFPPEPRGPPSDKTEEVTHRPPVPGPVQKND